MEQLLHNTDCQTNMILRQVQDAAQAMVFPPNKTVGIVQAAISMWYMSSSAVYSRDLQQGLPTTAEPETDRNGNPFLSWGRAYSANEHAIGNLGLMAMLISTELWDAPQTPQLHTATLISNATAVFLYATYLMLSCVTTHSASHALTATNSERCMEIYLRSAWAIARQDAQNIERPPAVEFGAHQGEIKLSSTGKRLLTKVGRQEWRETPYWHPVRRVPGSPWNKFMRNMAQPIFQASTPTAVWFNLPSSSLTLAEPVEEYYRELRSRFDQVSPVESVLYDSA